jgi:hypothetical protein
MASAWNRERWAALAGAIILTIALPIAIDQGYFRYNAHVLPALGAFAVLLYLGFFLSSPYAISKARAFRLGFCPRYRVLGMILFIAIFGVAGCLLGATYFIVLGRSKEHVAEIIRREAVKPPDVAPSAVKPPSKLPAVQPNIFPPPTTAPPKTETQTGHGAADKITATAKHTDLLPQIARDVGEIKNNIVPVQRHLTAEQRSTLVVLLRSGGSFETAVRHTQGNMESQKYADEFVAVLKEAGWTVNPHPKFLIQESDATGVWIMVTDIPKAPRCALLLQQGLKAIGIEAPGVAVSGLSPTPETACELFVGLRPN